MLPTKTVIDVDGLKVRRDPEGRVSLTDLWKQAGKQQKDEPNRYTSLDRCLKLAEASKTPNSGFSPVVTYKGNGGGTYAIEEIALDYCAWIDPTLALRVQRAFIALSKGNVQEAVAQAAPAARIDLADVQRTMMVVSGTIDILSKIPGVKLDILGAHSITLIEQQTGVQLQAMRLALPSRTEEQIPMNPTALGEFLGLGAGRNAAIACNKLLEQRGLQTHDASGKWVPTVAGAKYADRKPFQNPQNGHSDWQLMWRKDVIDALDMF